MIYNNIFDFSETNKNLHEKLVPQYGESSTIEGELIRIANIFAHEYYVHNNSRVVSITNENLTSSEYTFDLQIDEEYELLLVFLEKHILNKECVLNLRKFLEREYHTSHLYKICEDETSIYSNLLNSVIKQIEKFS